MLQNYKLSFQKIYLYACLTNCDKIIFSNKTKESVFTSGVGKKYLEEVENPVLKTQMQQTRKRTTSKI